MFEPSRARLERAIEIVDREVEILAAERKSFERFHARLSDVEPRPTAAAPTTTGAVGGSSALTNAEPPVGASLRAVRTAYRETVMDVPHFDDEYGDTLEQSLATEFGPEVASQVAGGTRLTPVLYRTLSRGTKETIRERKSFQRSLERERDSLLDVRSGLDECERRVTAAEAQLDGTSSGEHLAPFDDRLASVESTCAELASERQSLVHGRSGVTLSGVTGTSLVNYLYDECDATCPALATLAEVTDAIRDRRLRCLK